MFSLSNIRKVNRDGYTYLECDFNCEGIKNPFSENKMWFSVKEENEDMLTDKVYDPFVLVSTIMGMYYGQDVKICGNVSPRLYHNLTHYMMTIFDMFSDHTKKIKVNVEGFATVEQNKNKLIGTGISCGVDSLLTIYENYVLTTDENFKINSLFLFNCGTHGDFKNEQAEKNWENRVKLNKRAADELGLPMYLVNCNLHAFTHEVGERKIGYLAIYSCALALQKYIKRYITSNNLSYEEIMDSRRNSRDSDFGEFSESFFPHLVSTENFELVVDGCQYTRSEKIEIISDWDIAQKYLNVCIHPNDDGSNCSCCEKCMWTLIPLDAIGKLDKFSNAFDINIYKKNCSKYKIKFVSRLHKDSMETSIFKYAKEKGMKFPPVLYSKCMMLFTRIKNKIGRIAKGS